MWGYSGQRRPDFAIEPGPGQESVWDYPRPPRIETDHRTVRVLDGETEIACSENAVRMCETASPPTFYLPPADIDWSTLTRAAGQSHCEWKGMAHYWALKSDQQGQSVGWGYANPAHPFRVIAGYLSFYPARIACFVEDERVQPQPGHFYGGWITRDVVGPFKGEPGTGHW